MKRRKFIALSVMGSAAVSIPFFNCSSANSELDAKLSMPAMLSQICDKKTLQQIGKAYGRKNTSEYSGTALEKLLTAENKKIDFADMRSAIEKIIHTDFATGNILILEGWVLAVTEARQCALYSLVNKTD